MDKKEMPKIVFRRDEPSMVGWYEANQSKLWKVWFNYSKVGCDLVRESWLLVRASDLDEAIDECYDVLNNDDEINEAIVIDVVEVKPERVEV